MAEGYGYWWDGTYWASLTTGGKVDAGRHDLLFGVVGADTHGHIWYEIHPEGPPQTGVMLKDRGAHVGDGPSINSFSTQPVLRGRVEQTIDGGVAVELANVFQGSTVSASPVVSQRSKSSRNPVRVEIGVPKEARWFEPAASDQLPAQQRAARTTVSRLPSPVSRD